MRSVGMCEIKSRDIPHNNLFTSDVETVYPPPRHHFDGEKRHFSPLWWTFWSKIHQIGAISQHFFLKMPQISPPCYTFSKKQQTVASLTRAKKSELCDKNNYYKYDWLYTPLVL